MVVSEFRDSSDCYRMVSGERYMVVWYSGSVKKLFGESLRLWLGELCRIECLLPSLECRIIVA